MTTFTTNYGVLEATPADIADRSGTFPEMDSRNQDLIATLAHELRNPLAPISNGLQLLAIMNLGEEAESVCAMMARQVEQIVHMVNNLLDVSSIDCGKVLLDKQVFMISSVVKAAIEESSILTSENGMTLEVIDKSDAACVCGDLCRLTQVVCNLLNNSAKYGKSGGKILLEMEVSNNFVLIRVQDNGMGIAADRLEDIFGLYAQIEGAQGRGSAGLGIGLALVKSLVELHGGSVDVESGGLDCGSTFTVKLPLAQGIFGENVIAKVVSNNSSRPFRVLVVDDLRAIRFVTEQLLKKLGHEVQVAENGQLALAMLESFKPDIVLSDITMPVMNGHELARRIRELTNLESVCLVALTGSGQSIGREMAFDSGFDRHLTKPVDLQQLQDLFNELDRAKRDSPIRTDFAVESIPSH